MFSSSVITFSLLSSIIIVTLTYSFAQDSNELGRCPKPFQGYGVCRTSRDCPTFCCSRINREPTVGWSGKCCVPRFLTPIIRSKGWCMDKEDEWDKLETSGSVVAVCPFPDDVNSCGPTCTNSTECASGESCCTNVCGSTSCVQNIQGNTLK